MSIKKNFLYNILLNISNIAFPIITIPYVSRILGVDQIGEFSFVTTLVEYFVLFAALGKTLFGSREIAKLKDNKRSCNRLFNRLFYNKYYFIDICVIYFFIISVWHSTIDRNKVFAVHSRNSSLFFSIRHKLVL